LRAKINRWLLIPFYQIGINRGIEQGAIETLRLESSCLAGEKKIK
jgi:hypothetical protein